MRLLALANAHSLAHVTRLLEIAKVLRQRNHEVLFAGRGKYLSVAGWDGFSTLELPYISVDRVLRAIHTQKLWGLYPEAELETFIQAELALYREIQPDLVLIDNRPTARTSAELAGLPTAAVLNVHMSNYRRIPFYSLAQFAGRRGLPGLSLIDQAENAIERQLYDRVVMGGFNRIRRRLGLRRLYAYQHEEGDISLLADIPEFNPVRQLPAHARFIGPLTWHNHFPAPACLDQLRAGPPAAYFTLGSESLGELTAQLDELAASGIQIIVATGTTDVTATRKGSPSGVFFEQYVNSDHLLPSCDLVCCHGGNGTLYQALAHGLPLVVVATHAEQHFGGKRIQELGLGRVMTLKRLRRAGMASLIDTVREVLQNPSYRTAAQAFAAHLRGWRSAHLAADAIEALART